ncbi:MAG TPA: DUF4276 family protein [Sedimentisphaerales bacterium]|nr:DUF4276 family protein [Sedimentisphaerales bacterium]
MVKIHVLVEGQTEETFVNRILRSHFWPLGVYPYPRQLGKPGHYSGIVEYPRARGDILATLEEDTDSFCTTMFDYYGMPNSWPEREVARNKPFAEKPITIEKAMLADVVSELGQSFDSTRFIPYVQMHEFEALLFSDPKLLADGLELPNETEVQRIRDQFQSPEEINDGQETAPSKRILQLNSGYSKVMDGVLISQKIGLSAMRSQCAHFHEWIQRLEALAGGI